MSELTNPNTPVSEQDLKDFYNKIKPYLGTNAASSEDMAEIVTPLPSIPTRKIKYSTDEQVIGEWIDGKPLYQKVVDFGTMPNNGVKSANTGVLTVDTVISLSAIMQNSNYAVKCPDIIPNTTGKNGGRLYFHKNNGTIWIENCEDETQYSAYVIMLYTKTTD